MTNRFVGGGGLWLLCLIAASAAAPAGAATWNGIEPGVSRKADVQSNFGNPTKLVKTGGTETWAYSGGSAIEGTTQVQFRIDSATGVVERIDVFPRKSLDRNDVKAAYGPPCPPGGGKGCFVVKQTSDFRTYYLFGDRGLAVFFSQDRRHVFSFVYLSTIGPPKTATKETKPESGEDEWAAAAGEFSAVAPKAPPETRALELSGRMEAQHYGTVRTLPLDKRSGRDSAELALTVKGTAGDARAVAVLLARRDFVDPDRNLVDLDEGYVSIDKRQFSLNVGRMIASWGTANLFNPTDLLNPRDLRDPMDIEKRGAWMLAAGAIFGRLKLEGVYLPVHAPNQFPVVGITPEGTLSSHSPWVSGTLPQPGPIPFTYSLGQVAPPSPTFNRGQYLLRLAVSALGADLSASYGYLYDRMPTARVTVIPNDPPTSALAIVDFDYKRLHAVTFDLERSFGRLRTAAEAVVFKNARVDPTDPEDTWVSYVAGLDYLTATFASDHAVHLFLEFTETRALKGSLRTDALSLVRYPLRQAVLARVAYNGGSDFKIEVNAAIGLDRQDYFVNPAFEYSATDTVKLKLGGFVLGGDGTGFFGTFRNNSRVYGAVEATF